jgi:outer membrane murein-binding lipoprotein Lpp
MMWTPATFLIGAVVAATVALAGGTYVAKVVSIADGDTLTVLVGVGNNQGQAFRD